MPDTKETQDYSHGYFQGQVHSDIKAINSRFDGFENSLTEIKLALKSQADNDTQRDKVFQEHIVSDAETFKSIESIVDSRPSYRALISIMILPFFGWIFTVIIFYFQLNSAIAGVINNSLTPVIERIELIEGQLGELELIE